MPTHWAFFPHKRNIPRLFFQQKKVGHYTSPKDTQSSAFYFRSFFLQSLLTHVPNDGILHRVPWSVARGKEIMVQAW